MPKSFNYRFTGAQGECKSPLPPFVLPRVDLTAVQYNLNGREDLLKNIFACDGPLVIVMYAPASFMKYKSGIFSDTIENCPVGCTNVNHAMLLVGEGVKAIFYVYYRYFCRLWRWYFHRNSLLASTVENKTKAQIICNWEISIFRNSWGSQWGEGGYVKMLRDGTNNCNCACYAMYMKVWSVNVHHRIHFQ